MGYTPWGTKELDSTKQVTLAWADGGAKYVQGCHRKEMKHVVCGAEDKGERVRLVL